MKHKLERWDFSAAALLTLIMLSVTQRLYATSWAPGLELAIILAVLGVMLGMVLGLSLFKQAGVFWLSFGYSVTLIPLVSGWIMYQDIPWLERLTSLGGRLGNSLALFFSAQKVTDTLLFIIFTGIGFWLISLVAGYSLTQRGDFISAVAPAGIVLFIIQLYDSHIGDRVTILAIYALLSLLLMGRLTYIRKRTFWKVHRVSYSAESWTDLNITMVVAAVVLVILAWISPSTGSPVLAAKVAWEKIIRPMDEFRENLSNAVAGLKGNVQGNLVEFYGETLALGQYARSGEGIYLRITVPIIGSADRYYWRVRTYDHYENNQWRSEFSLEQYFNPSQTPLHVVDIHGPSSEFVFYTPRANLAILVTPVRPIWTSRPSLLSFSPTTENNIDPLMFQADPPILVGEQYVVQSNIINPTIIQLQNAGQIYPAWVLENYLQIPPNISPQIRDLAFRITRDAQTPYEKATAITNYLRTTITYSLEVDIPPDDNDPLTWFLFDYKKGFCNYYATAEVILLRSLGIPARMVVGFAQGNFEPPDKYTILEKDAHAWPEVYFPGIGWVEFEPTSGQLALSRQPGDISETEEPFSPTSDNPANNPQDRPLVPGEGSDTGSGSKSISFSFLQMMLLFGMMVVLMIGAVIAYTTGLLDKIIHRIRKVFGKPVPILLTDVFTGFAISPPSWLKRWAYFAGLRQIERTYYVVYQSLRWLGVKPATAQTPAEAANMLVEHLPEVAKETLILLKEFQRALFSKDVYDLKTARQAEKKIRRLAQRSSILRRMGVFREAVLRIFPQKPL